MGFMSIAIDSAVALSAHILKAFHDLSFCEVPDKKHTFQFGAPVYDLRPTGREPRALLNTSVVSGR
jgi:hypothetical protein